MQMNYIEALKGDADPTLVDFLDFYNSNYYMPFEAGVQATAGYYHGRDEVAAPWAFWTKAPGVDHDNKPIWYSETGGAANSWINGPGGTVGDGAITVALQMFNALVHSDASAYIYWQFSDGSQSDSTIHSLIGTQDLSDPNGSEKYAAFKHFSRFVRPGATRIEATFDNGFASVGGSSQYDTLHSVNVSAFLHEEDETLTYVLLNLTGSAEEITLNLPTGIQADSFDAFRSSESERFEQLPDLLVASGRMTLTLPRYSLVTLTGNVIVPAVAGDYDADGMVNAADFVVWKQTFGTDSPAADGNGNGIVDTADYVIWRDNLGANNSLAHTIPEPRTMSLLSISLVLAVAAFNYRQLHVPPGHRPAFYTVSSS
jgi:hypothetical protein